MAEDAQVNDNRLQDVEVRKGVPASAGHMINSAVSSSNEYDAELLAGLNALPAIRSRQKVKARSAGRRDLLIQTVLDSELYKYLAVASDIKDFKQRVVLLINKLGFTDFIFSLMDTTSEIDGVLYSAPSGFIRTYYSEAFYEYDITLQYLEANKGASVFRSMLDDFLDSAPVTTQDILRNRELSRLIKSYGYKDCYSVSLPSVYRGYCLMTIFGEGMSRADFRRCVNLCSGRLQLLCGSIDYICTERFASAIAGKHKKEFKLTPRPLELLKYIALEDCTLYQAADKMNISVKTANVHIANAKKVFGVNTSTAAVTQAIKNGLITLD